MKNLGWILAIFFAVVIGARSQSLNGIGMGVAVASVSQCTVASGAAVTLCPVTGDGLYLAVGSGSFAKIATGTVAVPVLTKINCGTSSQSNSGFTASSCLIN